MGLFGNQNLLLVFLLVFVGLGSYGQSDSVESLEAKLVEALTEIDTARLYCDISAVYSTSDPRLGGEYARMALKIGKEQTNDSLIIRAYLRLGVNFMFLWESDSAIFYTQKALKLSQKSKIEAFEFSILNNFGNIYSTLPQLDSATHYFSLARKIAEKEQDSLRLAAIFNNLGSIDMDKGEMQKSYENYLKALNLFEALDNKSDAAIALNNIGLVNQALGNEGKAIGYFLKAVGINVVLDNYYNLSMNYSNLGVSYKKLERYDSALLYYEKSNKLAEQHGLVPDMARNYHNLGNIYFKQKELLKAKWNFLKSLEISERVNLLQGITLNNLLLVDIDIEQGDFTSAKDRLEIVLDNIKQAGFYKYLEEYHVRMSSLYEHKGELGLALDYYKKYKGFSDSLLVAANKQQVDLLQTKYETGKNLLENQKLKDQNVLNRELIRGQRLIGLAILVTLVLSALLALNFYKSRRKLSKAFNALKELNDEVVLQKEKLEESNRTKDKMFSIIAHDLRSPFNSLMGFLDILIEDFETLEDKEKVEMLEVVRGQSVKTYGLLENLLQWSLMERGLIDIKIKEHDLFKIVKSQVSGLSTRAENKQITIKNNLQADTLLKVDENITKTIFRNLINNSIKFTNPGGTIRIESELNKKNLKVRVSDNGVGMSVQTLHNLFKNQMPDSQQGTNHEVGSGLGLRIVRDCVEKLNASIAVESELGVGSVFTVTFPL
jgi:signal transduction histidine kinase/Tfp pilus assembly protein PilF